MSLIQEALKRQQLEEEGALPNSESIVTPLVEPPPPAPPPPVVEPTIATPPTPPVIEKPQPTPSTPETIDQKPADKIPEPNKPSVKNGSRKKKRSKKKSEKENSSVLPAIGGMILLVILLLASVGGAIIYGLQHFGIVRPWKNSDSANIEKVCETNSVKSEPYTVTVSTKTTSTNNSPLAVAVAKQVDNTLEPLQKPQKAEAPKKEPSKLLQNSGTLGEGVEIPKASTASVTSVESVILPAVATPIPAPIPAPKPKPPVIWPTAKLKGIVGSGKGGAVMINKTVVGINEKIDGILIISIESKGVWLEYEKERRFLKVGKTLE